VKAILASSNPGKLRELTALLEPLGIDLVSQLELGIEGADETGATFVENALLKARHASECSGLPAIADDSGISVNALGGMPGVHSARYAGDTATDADNNCKLLRALEDEQDTSAHYECVIVFLRSATDPAPLIATGRWDGRLLTEPRGVNGFGYDPYFFIESEGRTVAELPAETKNRMSHRGQAVASLVRALQEGGMLQIRSDGR
jgi:XTP/dITP diphosphohydrolase